MKTTLRLASYLLRGLAILCGITVAGTWIYATWFGGAEVASPYTLPTLGTITSSLLLGIGIAITIGLDTLGRKLAFLAEG